MRNIHVTPEPVTLEGFQAVLKPSKFGYSLKAVVGEDLISKLETERDDCLKWAESKLKNPKRSTLKPTPWEEVSEGKYLLKFSWSKRNLKSFFIGLGACFSIYFNSIFAN